MANEVKKIKVPEFGAQILVIGTEKREGEYEGYKYSNVIIHGIAYKETKEGKKILVCDSWKVKADRYKEVHAGEVVEALYDRMGKITAVEVVEQTYAEMAVE